MTETYILQKSINDEIKSEVKIIEFKGKIIIFINDTLNKKGFDKTQQLNKIIYFYTNDNVIDCNIYKKELIQDKNQKEIKDIHSDHD